MLFFNVNILPVVAWGRQQICLFLRRPTLHRTTQATRNHWQGKIVNNGDCTEVTIFATSLYSTSVGERKIECISAFIWYPWATHLGMDYNYLAERQTTNEFNSCFFNEVWKLFNHSENFLQLVYSFGIFGTGMASRMDWTGRPLPWWKHTFRTKRRKKPSVQWATQCINYVLLHNKFL